MMISTGAKYDICAACVVEMNIQVLVASKAHNRRGATSGRPRSGKSVPAAGHRGEQAAGSGYRATAQPIPYMRYPGMKL